MMLPDHIKSNLLMIKMSSNAKKSVKAEIILERRIAQAKKDAEKLRTFAAKTEGRVADHCNALAQEIEDVIGSLS